MNVKFTNSLGTINFARLIEIDGITFHDISYSTSAYPNQPGVITTDTSIGARYITLSFDIDRSLKEHARILRILTKEGFLYINNRRIKCKINSVSQGEYNTCYVKEVVQFVADYPYFEDLTNTEVPIFEITGCLTDEFSFPGVFSTLNNGGIIDYIGSAICEPTIYIQVNNVSADGEDNEMILTITNYTTSEAIKISYTPTTGEIITIDCRERTITSNINGSLLQYITDDTFWNGFSLIPGTNEIETLLENGTIDVQVTAAYKNKYVEAIEE